MTWPSVRGIGVAVIEQDVGHAAGRLGLEGAALLDAEPVLLVDDREREVRERARPPGTARASRPRSPPGRSRSPRSAFLRESPVSEPVSSVTGDREILDEVADGRRVLPGEEVRRREQRRLPPLERGRRERPRRDRGLARADVALDEPEHRHRPREVVPDLVDRVRLVRRERRLVAELAGERRLERRPDRAVPPVVRDHGRSCATGREPAAARPCPAGARAARRTRAGAAPRRASSNVVG